MPKPDPTHPQRCSECAAWIESANQKAIHERLTGHDTEVGRFSGP